MAERLELKIKVDDSELKSAIKKAKRLKKLLKSCNALAGRLAAFPVSVIENTDINNLLTSKNENK